MARVAQLTVIVASFLIVAVAAVPSPSPSPSPAAVCPQDRPLTTCAQSACDLGQCNCLWPAKCKDNNCGGCSCDCTFDGSVCKARGATCSKSSGDKCCPGFRCAEDPDCESGDCPDVCVPILDLGCRFWNETCSTRNKCCPGFSCGNDPDCPDGSTCPKVCNPDFELPDTCKVWTQSCSVDGDCCRGFECDADPDCKLADKSQCAKTCQAKPLDLECKAINATCSASVSGDCCLGTECVADPACTLADKSRCATICRPRQQVLNCRKQDELCSLITIGNIGACCEGFNCTIAPNCNGLDCLPRCKPESACRRRDQSCSDSQSCCGGLNCNADPACTLADKTLCAKTCQIPCATDDAICIGKGQGNCCDGYECVKPDDCNGLICPKRCKSLSSSCLARNAACSASSGNGCCGTLKCDGSNCKACKRRFMECDVAAQNCCDGLTCAVPDGCTGNGCRATCRRTRSLF